MDSYLSMKSKLEPINLYTIADKSNISNELKAYAESLDKLFDTYYEMLRECFIVTAQTYGIENREKSLGAERKDYSLEKRREMLISKEQNIGLKCTPQAFNNLVSGYGVTKFSITEDFSNQTVTITINDSLSDELKLWITQSINNDFPTHLKININFTN